MSTININGANLGSVLMGLLMADTIEPGTAPSYQLCKEIFSYHPLGRKMTATPIMMAQSQKRILSIPNSPEDRVRQAFEDEWKALGVDKIIANVATLARVYGIASVAMLCEGTPSDRAVNYEGLYNQKISFNVFDPLNTAGSLVMNQQPNAIDFQKHIDIAVNGTVYHRSRSCTILNEQPVYIEYTGSAFGFVGRSVYQRALFPLKSYLNTLVANDMVARKVGLLVAKMKAPGSIVDRVMLQMAGAKRNMLKEGETNNVLTIDTEEEVESLNLQNLDAPLKTARTNILEDCALAADMPAKIINAETFAEGFGEGTEDAKNVARFVDDIRGWMGPLYDYFTKIVQYRAWNPDFYKTIQNDFPDYKGRAYTQAFYEWRNSFMAEWPNLLVEPDSEKVKVEEVKLSAIIELVNTLMPHMDPENKATLIAWAQDNFNELKLMFGNPLMLDFDLLKEFTPDKELEEAEEEGAGKGGKSNLRVAK